MRRLLLVLLPVLATTAPGRDSQLPAPISAGKDACLGSALIYPLDNRPTPQCHASTLAETPTGVVAAWFGGTREGHRDVGIWISRNIEGKWSKPVLVADGSVGEEQQYPCWNPVLFLPQDGPLMLFYKVGPSPSTWWGVVRTSADNARSWSAPRKLGTNNAIGHLLGPVKNKPIQLKDESILCPSSSEHDGWRVHFEISRDLGKTWQVIGPINDGKKFAAIQPSILNYPDGRMQVMCRSQQNAVTQSWSDDHGRTWSPMSASNLPNPNAGTDAVSLKDGRQLIIYNHTVRGDTFPSGRNMLNAAISSDGKDWKPILTLERAQGEYSYPAVIQTKDLKIHITYTYLRQSVKHVVIDPGKF
ncbi:MAG: exo-alpha-sialidase [Verrucomicrobiaceae bacterium]|nr:exo-alpha-sialidase [Verrucomicrobiaceae bacterium]